METSGDGLDVQADDAGSVTPTIVRLLGGRSDVDVLGVGATSASMEAVYFEVMGVRAPTNGGAA